MACLHDSKLCLPHPGNGTNGLHLMFRINGRQHAITQHVWLLLKQWCPKLLSDGGLEGSVPNKKSISSSSPRPCRIQYRNDSIWQRASFTRLPGNRVNNLVLSAASLMVEFCRRKGGSASPCITSPGTCKCSLDPAVFSGLLGLKHRFFSRLAG